MTDPGPATVRHLSARELFLLEPVFKQLRVEHFPDHVHTGTRRNFDTAGNVSHARYICRRKMNSPPTCRSPLDNFPVPRVEHPRVSSTF